MTIGGGGKEGVIISCTMGMGGWSLLPVMRRPVVLTIYCCDQLSQVPVFRNVNRSRSRAAGVTLGHDYHICLSLWMYTGIVIT